MLINSQGLAICHGNGHVFKHFHKFIQQLWLCNIIWLGNLRSPMAISMPWSHCAKVEPELAWLTINRWGHSPKTLMMTSTELSLEQLSNMISSNALNVWLIMDCRRSSRYDAWLKFGIKMLTFGPMLGALEVLSAKQKLWHRGGEHKNLRI